MATDPVTIAEQALGKPLYQEQKDMIYPMFEALQKKGLVFVGQGPTGMGKTYVVGAVTKALVELGKRVCIAVPSYIHLEDVMGSQLKELGVEYSIMRGLSALKKERDEGCPLKNMEIPSSVFCSDSDKAKTGPRSETCKNIDCTVRREIRLAQNAKVVLTVFHKLIYNPSLVGNFDVVIFDESHGLEDALRNGRLAKIRKRDFELLKPFAIDHSSALNEAIETIDRVAAAGLEEVNPMLVERQFSNKMKEILPTIEAKIRETEEASGRSNSNVTEAYFTLSRSISSIDMLDGYKFVYHNESILGIPERILFVRFRGKEISKNTAIGLVSATIENAKFHAKDSGFSFYTLAPPVQIQSERMIRERFSKRPIFGLVDGPILRKDPNFREAYQSARLEANKIIADLVPKFHHPTLILCRSGEDARNIESYFKSMRDVHRRIFLFDEEGSQSDLDAVQNVINNKIEQGRDIIVTTAASRLWEGVNLNGLRFLIIDALPYGSPQPYDKYERNVWSSWRTSRTFRFMIRRMQQGVGRLVRSPKDPWGVVVVVDGRFNAQWNTIRTALPSYMTDLKIIEFVPREKIASQVMEKVNAFENISSK